MTQYTQSLKINHILQNSYPKKIPNTQNYPKLPKITQNYPKLPKITQRYSEDTQRYPKIHKNTKNTQKYPNFPKITQSTKILITKILILNKYLKFFNKR